jgi:hypothetical protein
MAAHAAPPESQRAHWNEYAFTGPVHSPGSAVSDCPSTAAPAMDGGVERTGGLLPGGLRPLAVEIVTRATTTRRREMRRRRRGISRCIGGLYGFFTPFSRVQHVAPACSATCGTGLQCGTWHPRARGRVRNDHFRLLQRHRHECRLLASRLHRFATRVRRVPVPASLNVDSSALEPHDESMRLMSG